MSKAKWLFMFLLALSVAVPTYAVELTLGGFPSYMRTRARFISNATYISAMSNENAKALGFNDNDDNIFFADTTLRLTPQLVLSDAVTIRAQINVFDNNIWGGNTQEFFGGRSTVINSSLSFSDRFRGAILVGPQAIDDPGFFDVRMLHADIVLPHNLGFLRIGRQPFDWGIGILANGGWDPYSDLGFVLDRFLYLKSFAAGSGSLTFVLVSDRFAQGNSIVTGGGDGWDGGALAIIFNNPNTMGTNFTLGGYIFPYIHQDNLCLETVGIECPGSPPGSAGGTGVDANRYTLFSGLLDVKTDVWRLVGEFQAWQGELNLDGLGDVDVDLSWIWAARAEVYPGWPLKIVAAEFGWAQGNDATELNEGIAVSGNGSGLVFNPAYNIDNLLFKNMIPTIYQQEGSVINAYYARLWGTVKIVDSISFTPQVLVAFNEQTENVEVNGIFGSGEIVPNVDSYLGTEVEGTITWHIHPGVSFDLIGGVVFAGSGLDQLLEAQAFAVLSDNEVNPDRINYDETPWTVQGRLMIFIDQFFK